MPDRLIPNQAAGLPDDGGWLSGSTTIPDDRPQYSPAVLVHEVIILLRRADIRVREMSPGGLLAASIASADLLTALGVRPVALPHRAER